MNPTLRQVTTYFRRLDANYDDLIKLLGEAKADLNTIFAATDKPIPSGESLAGLVLEAALGLGLPEGKVFFTFVNNMVDGAKKMKDKIEELDRYQNVVDQTLRRLAGSAASRVSTQYHNGAMGMIKVVNEIADRLYSQKALNMRLWEVFESLLGVKAAEPLFRSIDWNKPPALIGESSADVRYIFTYMLLRLAVFLFVRLNLNRQNNPFDLKLTELLVTGVEPEGISKAGCDYIFANFRKSIPDSRAQSANNGSFPATRIVAIHDYFEMIEHWLPDIDISVGTHQDLVDATHPRNRRRYLTIQMIQIAQGMKAILPVVMRTPEFRWVYGIRP